MKSTNNKMIIIKENDLFKVYFYSRPDWELWFTCETNKKEDIEKIANELSRGQIKITSKEENGIFEEARYTQVW